MDWTTEEKERYHQVESEKLKRLYSEHNISKDPEAREKFLEEYLGVGEKTKGLISHFSGKGDNLTVLTILEKAAGSE